jgi:hypothetical protein
LCGYNEIENPRQRYSLISLESLMELLNIRTRDELRRVYEEWVGEALKNHELFRQPKWTEGIAVGSKDFVSRTKEKLGIRALGREVVGDGGSFELREPVTSYDVVFDVKNADLRPENTYFWDATVEKSAT